MANILLYGPHTNIRRQGEIEEREGDVNCLLWAVPNFPASVERVRYPGDEETPFSLLNVDCVIYPDPASAKKQLMRLERMMEELERLAAGTA